METDEKKEVELEDLVEKGSKTKSKKEKKSLAQTASNEHQQISNLFSGCSQMCGLSENFKWLLLLPSLANIG